MRLSKLKLVYFFAGLFTVVSCQKEFSNNQFVPTGGTNAPNIKATVQGRVFDETGRPVSGAEVRSTSLSVFTDINGNFRMQNAGFYDDASFISVIKAGYFTGSRTFISRNGESYYVEVKLLRKTTDGVLNSSTGGTVKLNNGASVTLPASGVINKTTNTAYSGKIGVSIAWIDPTSTDLTSAMPGDLRGLNSNNIETGLQSFGMLAVELKGNGNEELQIAADKKASLQFPIPSALASIAPATIPLWSFNETTGLWKQEGTAVKTGSYYLGEVSHFSFWNCDAPFPVIDFTATIKDQNNAPLRHMQVKIARSAANAYSTAWTDSSGVVKGKVPSNETLTIQVLNSCNNAIYTQNIGPFTAAANINITANVTNVQAATITGNAINCTGGAVLNGSIELLLNQRVYRARITGGTFTLNLSVCSNSQSATLVTTDSTTQQQGTSSIIVLTGTNNAGTLTACGLSTNQFINFSVGGTAYSLVPPGDSLSVFKQGTSTSIQGNRISVALPGASTGINFSFAGITTGSYPLQGVFANVPFPVIDSATLQSSTTITITEYGNPGEYVAGSFNGVLVGASTTATYPIQCSFRVKRRN